MKSVLGFKRCVVALLAAMVSVSTVGEVRADTAFFSFQGTFSTTSGASETFNLTLPTIAGNNPLTLKTLSYNGGTNTAGQTILGGGIDSILSFDNAVAGAVGYDDDISPNVPSGNRDSLLSPTGTNGTTNNDSLLANQLGGSHTLKLTNFGVAVGDSHWAADLVNAATSANTLLTAATGTNSSITSLSFGSTGTSNATVQLPSSTLTLASTGALTVGSGGVLNLNGGTLAANGNINVSGSGQIIQSSGTFNWGASKTMTIGTGGHVDILSGFTYSLPSAAIVNLSGSGSRFKVANGAASTFTVGSGSQVNVSGTASLLPDFLFVGTTGTGTVFVNGGTLTAGGTLAGNTNIIGSGGNTGTVTLTNLAVGTFTNPLQIGDSGGFGTSGTLNVQSAANVTVGNLAIGTGTTSIVASGTLNVIGISSIVGQTAGSATTIGGAAGTGSGQLNISTTGTFSSAGSLVTVNKTGSINIGTGGTGGGFYSGTATTLNGGSLFVDSTGSFYPGSTFTIQNGGSANIAAVLSSASAAATFNVTVDNGSSLTLSASGNTFGFNGQSSTVTFSNGSTGTLSGSLGLSDQSSVFGSTGILNVQSNSHVSGSAGGVSLSIGTNGVSSQAGALNVDGPGSTFNQGAASPATITIGASSGSSGAIFVSNHGAFTSGTGTTNINTTGAINVGNAGTYNANGVVNVYGQINIDNSAFTSTTSVDNVGAISISAASTFSAKELDFNGNASFSSSSSTTNIGSGGISMGGLGTLPTALISGGNFTANSLLIYTGNLTLQNGAHGNFPSGITNGAGGFDSSEIGTITVSDPGTTLNTPFFTLSQYTGIGVLTATNSGSFTMGTPTITTGVPAKIGSGGVGVGYAGPSGFAVINISNGGNIAYGVLPAFANINFTSGNFGFVGNLPVGFNANAPLGSNVVLGPSQSLAISGAATIDPGASLTLNGGSLSVASLVNNGNFNFNSGTLAFNSAGTGLTIGTGGALGASVNLTANKTIVGVALTQTNIASTGILYLNGGTLNTTGGIINNGEIQFLDTTSQLTGGAIFNYKLIDGNGRVSNDIANQTTGEIRATGAQRLTFTGATNTNAGKINMVNGGTIEFTGTLTNTSTGVITGRGALITNGLTNNGQLQLSGGFTDVYGTLTNTSGSKVIVTGGSTSTFYNDVTVQNGSEFRVSTNSTAVFFGNVHGTSFFMGSGIKDFEGPSASSLGDVVTLGSTVVETPAVVNANLFNELSLSVAGQVVLNPTNSGGGLSVLNTLAINGGKFDLADNDLIVDYTGATPASTIRSYLVAGYNGGAWNGQGLATSSATALTGLGYGENSDFGYSSFDGKPVDASALLVKYTYYGDSTLDGKVDLGNDFNIFLDGFINGASGWTRGDYNYDGVVNIADFKLFLDGYAAQGAALGTLDAIIAGDSELSSSQKASLLSVVPEPGSIGLFATGAMIVANRRRRK